MKSSTAKYLAIFSCATLLAGCESPAMRNLLPAGAALLGGAACHKLFEGKNQKMATAICAAGGLWLGEKLKAHLNQQEQAQLAEATYSTLDSRKPQTIKTATGTTIRTEFIAAPRPTSSPPIATQPPRPQPQATPAQRPTPQPQTTSTPGQTPNTTIAAANECGTVKQTIITKTNERFEDTVNACKKDGVWVAA